MMSELEYVENTENKQTVRLNFGEERCRRGIWSTWSGDHTWHRTALEWSVLLLRLWWDGSQLLYRLDTV